MKNKRPLLFALSLSLAAGCAPEPSSFSLDECDDSEVCDVDIKALWKHRKDVDVGDLVNIGAGFATDALNDALGNVVALDKPELYTSSDSPLLDDASVALGTMHDIDELVTNLAAVYGAHELTTEVNAARAEHLRSSSDKVFAESAFTISAKLSPSWNIPTGFDDCKLDVVEDPNKACNEVNVNIGFRADADLESRVIAAYSDVNKANALVLRDSVKAARGFVLPRNIKDIRSMDPGESFALSGRGTLGVNLGLSVPFLIANPVAALTYEWIVSAHWGTQLSGEIDVQLVRLQDDQVVVDVGIRRVDSESRGLALRDKWGVQGLVDMSVDVAGYDINLGKLLDRAVEKELNKRLSLISGEVSSSERVSRLSLSRVRFFLDRGNSDEVEQALAQALRADVRLAQSLAYRDFGSPSSGIIAEFDLMRGGTSESARAGLDILGMSFFRKKIENEGTAVVQTPGGVLTLLWNSLHKEAGSFISRHGYARVGIAGLVVDSSGLSTSDVNLIYQITEGDEHIPVNKVLDHADPLLANIGGDQAFAIISKAGNALAAAVWNECNPKASPTEGLPKEREFLGDDCVVDFVRDHQFEIDDAVENYMDALPHDLNGDQVEILRAVAKLRMSLSAVIDSGDDYDHPNPTDGPPTSMVMDYRLDDATLKLLMGSSEKTLRTAVMDYLGVAAVSRIETASGAAKIRGIQEQLFGHLADDIAKTFRAGADRYLKVTTLQQKGRHYEVGSLAGAVQVGFVSKGNAADYASASAKSLAALRSEILVGLIDDLIEEADRLNDSSELDRDLRLQYPAIANSNQHPEQTVAYSLMSLVPNTHLDLRVNVHTDTSDPFLGTDRKRYREAGLESADVHVLGTGVKLLDGGLFDLNALINVD